MQHGHAPCLHGSHRPLTLVAWRAEGAEAWQQAAWSGNWRYCQAGIPSLTRNLMLEPGHAVSSHDSHTPLTSLPWQAEGAEAGQQAAAPKVMDYILFTWFLRASHDHGLVSRGSRGRAAGSSPEVVVDYNMFKLRSHHIKLSDILESLNFSKTKHHIAMMVCRGGRGGSPEGGGLRGPEASGRVGGVPAQPRRQAGGALASSPRCCPGCSSQVLASLFQKKR